LSQADVKANLLRQIMHYPDFDQVLSRLMIPVRHDESSLHIADWNGSISRIDGDLIIKSACGQYQGSLKKIISTMFVRGVILIAFSDTNRQIYPAVNPADSLEISHIVGIGLDANALLGEMEYALRHFTNYSAPETNIINTDLKPLNDADAIKIVIIGCVHALPLMLKRLLNSYNKIDVSIIDDLNREEHIDQMVYLRRRIGEMDGASDRITTEIRRWSFSDMDFLRGVVKGADKIIISRPAHVTKRPHAIISNVLSHLLTILDEIDEKPYIFPVVDTRNQASMLQKELYKFDIEHEVHVVVPDEFYGTYVAHTSFGMFAAQNEEIYNSQRLLRYVINDLMEDSDGDIDLFDIDAMEVTNELPDSLQVLFDSLLEQQCILIGYRLNGKFERTDGIHETIFKAFPREDNFRCLRQTHLVLNPFGSAMLEETWLHRRSEIAELIVLRMN